MIHRVRNADPDTSYAAAQRVDEFSHVHFGVILDALKRSPGTIYEIGEATALTHVQVARRMPELEEMGYVSPYGVSVSPTGRKCRVWYLLGEELA